MTSWRGARLLAQALAVVVLVVSAVYLLLYLYRWEWNRALISGLFFVATLVTISTSLILGALRDVSSRLTELERRAPTDSYGTGAIIRDASARRARRHFRWLEESSGRLSVFIPVLLGAGALLSGISYVLERLAGAVAGATIDRRTVALVQPDLPLGPSQPSPRSVETRRAPADPLDAFVPSSRPAPRGRVAARAISGVVLTLALVAGITVLREATQSRPEPGTSAGTTAIVLEVRQRRRPRPADEVAQALWVSCRARLGRTVDLANVTPLSDGTVRIEIDEGLGPLRRRRFFGCLEDATIDLVQARVIDFEVR